MIDCAGLLIVDIIKRVLISGTATCISYSSVAVHLHLHQYLPLTLLTRITLSLQNILWFSKISPLLVVFLHCIRTKLPLMIIHHSLPRFFFLPIEIMISLNNNILSLSSNQYFGWNSRIEFPSVAFELISLWILIVVCHVSRNIAVVAVATDCWVTALN